MLVNGVNPGLDGWLLKSCSYGKIRIWGTFGYAMGSQLAGLIYKFISPQAIFIVFIGMMCVSILGVLGIRPKWIKVQKTKQMKMTLILMGILKNKTYFILSFLLWHSILEWEILGTHISLLC